MQPRAKIKGLLFNSIQCQITYKIANFRFCAEFAIPVKNYILNRYLANVYSTELDFISNINTAIH
jgi:hypothetical protein